MRRDLAIVALLVACGHGSGAPAAGSGSAPSAAASAPPAAPPTPPPEIVETPQPAELDCTKQPFAESTPLHEASAAAWLTVDGKQVLVAISDSGNAGEYALIDGDTGATLELAKLPLGDHASDDIEGLAVQNGKLYGLTSAGWMRVWERRGGAFALIAGPYPIGPVDLPDGGGGAGGNTPPTTDGMVCGKRAGNCGRNYEGLCLPSRGPGFVAAKADGHLWPIAEVNGSWQVSHATPIEITKPGAMADCAFDDQDRLWVGNNLFGLSMVYRVDGWRAPVTAKVVPIGPIGPGFPEVVAARGEMLYRMSDTNGAPSLMAKFRCVAKQR